MAICFGTLSPYPFVTFTTNRKPVNNRFFRF
ncbi:hypothetical protein FAES_1725 [Fibrella aestuarina BUZ 2]|uniref:Uncharacterized protein n=1 Tax=Fibrella aestuarina BUZ 2 TaxID=1166018 RepID=I0K6I2_9BACT|nr:hypothetical protein FAES_1725 [Fibrella aestuarina BUZ 2]